MRPTYLAVVLSISAKYGLLYLFLMAKNQDYYFLTPGIRDGADLFYYLWLLLGLPFMEAVCFSGPLYWALRTKKRGLAAVVTLASILLGAALYTCLASPADLRNGVVVGLIGCVLQGGLFLKARLADGAPQTGHFG